MPPHPNLTEKELKQLLINSNYLTDDVLRAIEIANLAHSDKIRDTGTYYLEEHIYPITASLLEILIKKNLDFKFIEKTLILGLLHDTLEDAPDRISLIEIESSFGKQISQSLQLLTKTPETNVRHLPRDLKFKINRDQFNKILESKDLSALYAKCADRYNNICSIKSKLDSKDRFYNFLSDTTDIYLVKEVQDKCPEFYKLIQERINLLEDLVKDYF